MPQLIFTNNKLANSIGYIGGGVEKFPLELWEKIPNSENYQTHLLTLYPNFYHESEKILNYRISIFISLENHILGGVQREITDKYTINQIEERGKLNSPYAIAIFYEVNHSIEEYNLSKFSLPRKYFHELEKNSPELQLYKESERSFFETNGTGLEVSKIHGIFYFIEDKIILSPKYSSLLQVLEEDIDNSLHIFQNGIGYFFLDKNIKKLKHGDKAGVFFIQN